jgi:hypothetical protein
MGTDLAEASAADDDMAVSAGDLSIDVLANILGYLDGPEDIMHKRQVCKKWKETVKKTVVPPNNKFRVHSVDKYNAMNVMTRALPNLQHIMIGGFGDRLKYSDGDDPSEELAAVTADRTSLDIGIISNFSKLRILTIDARGINGRYPFLFNSFPLLQKLSILYCDHLKWDLEMLAGLPLLKELYSSNNSRLTGNIGSLSVLKDTLEMVAIEDCDHVEGNLIDLADFPHLKELHLLKTAVTGDIRDINTNDFSSLEYLAPPKNVYGGWGYELQRISDAPDLMRALYLFNKQRPNVIEHYTVLFWILSGDSPDWYESAAEDGDTSPFYIHFVQAGSRVGYRWRTNHGIPCEVNWLDPEPERESSDYIEYIEVLQQINSQLGLYRGFHQPPTEEEYSRLHNL